MLFMIFILLMRLLNIYCWVLLASCIFINLCIFGVLDARKSFVQKAGYFLEAVTEPVLAPVRRILPDLGGVDFSPMVVLLLIRYAVQPGLIEVFRYILAG